MFDTHRAVRELTDAGFALEQAEAVVATVSIRHERKRGY